MQAGALLKSDVMAYTDRVLVNGTQRPHLSWSIDRELSGDLPAQVVAVSGLTQASGSIEWSSGKDLEDGARNPWNKATGWLPARGDRVEIFTGDGLTEWKKFHGVIDRTSGNVGQGFRSTLIDDYDRLSTEVSHEALMSIMPPLAWDGSEPYRLIGLHPLYYVDYALRMARFYATPPREPNTNLYAPLQGSLWPNYGFLRASGTHGFNTVTPWGLGRRDFAVTYDPIDPRPMSSRTQLSMMIAPDHAGPVDFFIDYGSTANHLRLNVNSSRLAIAMKNGVEVCRLPMGAATVISMLCTGGVLSLQTDLGASASGTFTNSGGSMSAIRVSASANASVAGLQVSHPQSAAAEHMSTRWVPSAVLDATSLVLTGVISAGPTIEKRRVDDLLREINDAVLASMWIDEHGVMQWVASDTLRRRPVSRAISTKDDIFGLSWEDGLLQSSSKVTVTGKRPSITRGRWRSLVLARGGGGSLKSGDVQEMFLEPAGDEDWVMPSFSFIEVGGSGGIWSTYNNPAYSATGLYYTADGGTTDVAGLSCTITTEQIGLQKCLVKYVAGTWPSDVEGVIGTSPTAPGLWPKNRNQDLPRLIGRGRIQWTEESVSVTGVGGPGPEMVHDAGVWANRTDSTNMLSSLAEYLAGQTSVPQPVITGLEIVYDPRLQLGDVVSVESPDLMGVELAALVIGISESAGGTFSQSLSVRIISATSTFTTYAELNDSLPGTSLTYAQWQALGPLPQTYAQFNTAT